MFIFTLQVFAALVLGIKYDITTLLLRQRGNIVSQSPKIREQRPVIARFAHFSKRVDGRFAAITIGVDERAAFEVTSI